MNYRKLRIAWSVVWGVACLLLIALWVRSYWRWDRLNGSSFGMIVQMSSIRGTFNGRYFAAGPGAATPWSWSSFSNLRLTDDPKHIWGDGPYGTVGFGWYSGQLKIRIDSQSIQVPYWFPVMLFLTLGAAAWLPWRFSLRTLLIAMTLVAVVLGAILYAVR
jgi:hypothetical protein